MDGVVVAEVGVQEASEGFFVHAGVAEGNELAMAEVATVGAEDGLVGVIEDFGDAGGVVVDAFEDVAGGWVDGAHDGAAVVGQGDVFMQGDAIGIEDLHAQELVELPGV